MTKRYNWTDVSPAATIALCQRTQERGETAPVIHANGGVEIISADQFMQMQFVDASSSVGRASAVQA